MPTGIGIASFVGDGFVRVPGAVPGAVVEECRARSWAASGCSPDDVMRIGALATQPFRDAAGGPAPREAYDQVVGAGRRRAPAGGRAPSRCASRAGGSPRRRPAPRRGPDRRVRGVPGAPAVTRLEEPMADAVGAEQGFLSTCGSSLSVKTAMLAVAGPGEKVLISRNAHKSVIAAVIVDGVEPVWAHPEFDPERPPCTPAETTRTPAASRNPL